MLAGRSEIEDKLSALNIGADDYLCKPCDPRELLAKIRTIRGKGFRYNLLCTAR